MKFLILIMFCLSPMAFAASDHCPVENGQLHTVIGTYKFQTIKLCQVAYKRLTDCQRINNLRGEKDLPPVENCMDILKAIVDSKTVVKISDFSF